jgi:predicted nucleic acid-binding protein
MTILLLDTNIVSFLYKGDIRAKAYTSHLKGNQLAVSFMTVAELYQWAAVRDWGERRKQQLEETLKVNYLVLAFDVTCCQIWGDIRANRRAMGKTISPEDACIASTALQHKLPLVTHNPTDFEDIEKLEIITAVV